MDKGFMFLHRQLLDWEWFDNSNMVHVWIYLLLKANYQDENWHGVLIPRGSFVTSIGGISKDTSLSTRTIRTCLDKLKSTGEVTIKTTNKYSIVTICKYDSYNITPSEIYKQPTSKAAGKQTNKRQTSDKQLTISNNNNKDNKEIKEEVEANASSSSDNDVAKKEEFDYDSFCSFFNKTLTEHDSMIPKVRKIDGRRKNMIHARIKDYGVDAVYEVTEKAASNRFLNGGGSKGWTANFDWIFGPDNFRKVIEGNYDDEPRQQQTPKVEQSKIEWE